MASMIVLWIVLGLIGIGVLWAIYGFNRLVRLRVRVDNAWSQIDVQLRRRYDLIPNLVETVKGYATHERQVFESVVAARAAAIAPSTSVAAQASDENVLTTSLRGLLAVAEGYPDLKANQQFLALQSQLAET